MANCELPVAYSPGPMMNENTREIAKDKIADFELSKVPVVGPNLDKKQGKKID